MAQIDGLYERIVNHAPRRSLDDGGRVVGWDERVKARAKELDGTVRKSSSAGFGNFRIKVSDLRVKIPKPETTTSHIYRGLKPYFVPNRINLHTTCFPNAVSPYI